MQIQSNKTVSPERGTTRTGYYLGSQQFDSKPVAVQSIQPPQLSPTGLGMVFNGRILTETGPVDLKDLVIDFDPNEKNPDGTPVSESHYWDPETFQLLVEYAKQHPELAEEADRVFAEVRKNQEKLYPQT